MVPFFVLPPADDQPPSETSFQRRPRNAQAAEEQAFYETHGSEGAVRLLWLVEWLGQALQSRLNLPVRSSAIQAWRTDGRKG